MKRQLFINRMTLEFLKWTYYMMRETDLMEVRSANDIKRLLLRWTHPNGENPSEAFIKGAKFHDFDAIYKWICDQQGYDLHRSNLATELLKCVFYTKTRTD